MSAEPQASSEARAQALFEEGLVLLGDKSYAAACAKFEESQRFDPAAGTVFNIAICEQSQGHFARALQRWKECLAQFKNDDSRRPEAERYSAEAESKVARLVLRASPQAPQGTAVSLDDRPVDASELAAAIVVDPGSHHLVVTAPGHEPRTVTITTASGETREVALTPGPAVRAPISTPGPIVPLLPSAQATAQPFSLAAAAGRHKASLATLGAGIALAAAGTGVALDIVGGRYHDFVQKCSSAAGCSKADQEAISARATAVNVLFSVAGAAGLAAVGIFFFAESEPSAGPRTQVGLAVGPAGVTITARR